jgi:hypothetical protein
MRAHKLKIWPEHFRAVRLGNKKCELRRADRDFRVGDSLMLVEFDPREDRLTGAYQCCEITHITKGEDVPRALLDGFVILSIDHVSKIEEETMLGKESMAFGSVEWVKHDPS